MAKKKVKSAYTILYSKTGGIRDIIDPETRVRTAPLRRALNMFVGQQEETARKRGIGVYIMACIAGNESVINSFHYQWNRKQKEEEV